jgi:hypothetical protein
VLLKQATQVLSDYVALGTPDKALASNQAAP